MEIVFPEYLNGNFQRMFLMEPFVKRRDAVINLKDVIYSPNNNNATTSYIEFKFLDSLSDELIILFFKDNVNITKLSSKLHQFEFKDYNIFIYVPYMQINNSPNTNNLSEYRQKNLWFRCDNDSKIHNNQDIMIDFL